MSLTGHVQNGVVVFDTPNPLPDGTAVRVEALEIPPKPATRSLLDRLGDVVGKAADFPPDASQNVDHYLYGHPKKSPASVPRAESAGILSSRASDQSDRSRAEERRVSNIPGWCLDGRYSDL
ncbi:MAG: hypothetical protein ACJ8FY_04470 [Gemmataceae bacterium]